MIHFQASETLVEALIYVLTVLLIYAIYRSNPEKAKASDVEQYIKVCLCVSLVVKA